MKPNNSAIIRFTTVALAFLSLGLASLAVASDDGSRTNYLDLNYIVDIGKVRLPLATAKDVTWAAASERDRVSRDREERDRTERESTPAPTLSTRSSHRESRRGPHKELWDARQLRDFIETFAGRPELTCGSISLSFPTTDAKDRRATVTFKYPEEVRIHLIEVEVKKRLAEEELKRQQAEEDLRKQQIQKKSQELTYLQSTTRFVCKWVPPLCFVFLGYKIVTSSYVSDSVSGILKGTKIAHK